MRFGKLRIRNMGVFRGEHEFDIGGSVGPIVGVCGENGSGKTTMLGLLLGGIYRECPTRGSLLDLATARDSFVEVEVSNGSNYRFRQLCDAVSKKSETLITDGEGRPLVESGKVTEAKAFVAKHFPALDLVLNSTFGAQKSAGFVGMKPAERKSLLLQLLGVERLERLAESSRERAKGQRLKSETLEARMGDERARCGELAALETALSEAQARVVACDQAVADARVGLDVAVDDARGIEAQDKEHATWAAARAALETELEAARKTVADLDTRVRNNRAIQAEGGAIRAARLELETLGQRSAELDRDSGGASALAAQRETLARAEADVRTAKTALDAAKAAGAAADARVSRAQERLVDEPRVNGAEGFLAPARELAARAKATVEATESALTDRRGRTLADADARNSALRGGLETIAALPGERLDEAEGVALRALDADDKAIGDAIEVPARIKEIEQQHYSARVDLAGAERALAVLEALAARADEMTAARAELAAAVVAATEADHSRAGALSAHDDAAAALAGEQALSAERAKAEAAALRTVEEQRQAIHVKRSELEPLAAKYDRLIATDARLAELEPQLETARATAARLEAQASATPAPPPPQVAPDVAAYRATLEQAEREARAAHSSVAVAEQRLATAQESAARLTVLQAEVDAVSGELADWNRLAADLGKDGLQAMVIDAAIPELNHTANELLWSAFGPRFTVDVRTQASDSKGKRLLETLDVVVLDSELGREALAETLSGGELVVVSEALSLALTVLACRQSGVERPTIIRDESGSALSEGKAPQWIAMLRKAAEIINADRILFVSHTQATWELADSCIHIGTREAA